MTALILYTTSGGNSEFLVEQLKLGAMKDFEKIDVSRVEKAFPTDMGKYDFIVFVTPTYQVGNLPYPFEKFVENSLTDKINLGGTPCVCIVLGNSEYYDIFCGARVPLEKFVRDINANQINDTILIDGETFDRADEWIKLGENLSSNLLDSSLKSEVQYKNLDLFFSPKSILVVGVSENPSKIGHQIFNNIIKGGYKGGLIGVNPNPSNNSLYNHALLKNIEDINSIIDLAILAIPAEYVSESIEKCIKRNITNFVIISAGFKEAHNETGVQNQKALDKIILENPDLNILGPNCLGFINSKSSLNASFARTIDKDEMFKDGNIAFISQSGAICTELLDKSNYNGNKYQLLVSIGNKSSIDEADILNYIKSEPEVKVVGAYLETYANKEKFENSLSSSQPLITLLNGQSESSISAMSSHTGAFVRKNDFLKLSLEKSGIITVDSLHEMDNTLGFFGKAKIITENSFIILTNAGGPGVVLADLFAKNKLFLKKLSGKIQSEIKSQIPMSSGENPIDIVGDATSERFETALKILTSELKPQNIIVYITPQSITDIDEIAKLIVEWNRKHKDSIIPLLLGEESFDNACTIFNQNQIPFFRNDEHLADTLKSYLQRHNLESEVITKSTQVESELKVLDINTTHNLIKSLNLSVPLSEKILKVTDIGRAFENLKNKGVNKFVLKIDNIVSSHKTELGGVNKNITDIQEIEKIYLNWTQQFDNISVPCVLQEQIEFDLEFFCGIKKDSDTNLGIMMIIGMGGIYTNIMEDVTKFLLPVDEKYLVEEIGKLKISAIINGARGKRILARDALVDELMKLQSLAFTNKSIKEIDVNPILLSSTKAVCADIKIYT